jgi:hypothetical protein
VTEQTQQTEQTDAQTDAQAAEEATPASVETTASDAELVELAREAGVTVDPDAAHRPEGGSGNGNGAAPAAAEGEGGAEAGTDDLVTVEMMSAWGDTWVWNDVDPTVSQEVFKMLGEPDVLSRIGDDSGDGDGHGPRRHTAAGAVGGELGAE